jgi:hypothetical protein
MEEEMTPLEYKEKKLPLPVKALLIIRKLKENKFVKVSVVRIRKNTSDVVHEYGNVASMGIPNDDITRIGEVD